ncbi:3-phosphoserine/phosphohydroxythreonine transaminase [Alkalihalobacillus sp. AL-G]|uniref:3-phosphoserine/phosphohydroxythreonine transaminase n=1 Tax=Alkalihalobacillus sp. AL-G TaxID=2926399 RepID=UPI00272D19EB|nr:3-phosphoserine/phosphohydroxythreonine transaminase [Alkalihalobacillus sp. AL-G]WLD94081.1 3-phosphoserine/phosphohydroxythreonine transaminase [Alkalihalobacillus sp. AL-G]
MELFNFNPGPSALPKKVLLRAQEELVNYQNSGLSVLEMSHRSSHYEEIHHKAIDSLRRLLDIPESHEILLLQGGASLQFSMVPLNFLYGNRTGYYVTTGSWAKKAFNEAKKIGHAVELASSESEHFSSIPAMLEDSFPELKNGEGYVHITSNNTIYGTQWQAFEQLPSKVVIADMSSEIGTRKIPWDKFALVYAGAQKNLGPAGVTVVIIDKEWLHDQKVDIPSMMDYNVHAEKNSLHNTPPTFNIYLLSLMLEWIETQGGMPEMVKRAKHKSSTLYRTIDGSDGFYIGHSALNSRSKMNVTFRLPTSALSEQFLKKATDCGFVGLPGHRSIGGCRVSLYNGVTVESCEKLSTFMKNFKRAQKGS